MVVPCPAPDMCRRRSAPTSAAAPTLSAAAHSAADIRRMRGPTKGWREPPTPGSTSRVTPMLPCSRTLHADLPVIKERDGRGVAQLAVRPHQPLLHGLPLPPCIPIRRWSWASTHVVALAFAPPATHERQTCKHGAGGVACRAQHADEQPTPPPGRHCSTPRRTRNPEEWTPRSPWLSTLGTACTRSGCRRCGRGCGSPFAFHLQARGAPVAWGSQLLHAALIAQNGVRKGRDYCIGGRC